MRWNDDRARARRAKSVQMLAVLTLILVVRSAGAQAQPAEQKAAVNSYQTLYLGNLTAQDDARDIVTDLRNMLPKARIYLVSSQKAISIHGSAEDIQLAQKILSDIDRKQKIYRLTYSITEMDGDKQMGTKRYAVVVAEGGEKTYLKLGNRVPLVTGWTKEGEPTQSSQVQYLDVGLNLEASLEGFSDGLKLRTKIEQSNIADERSGIGAQDPVIHQTTLEGTSTLVPGKPLVVGTITIPGSTRQQEIEVVSEPVS
jgi:hypothetical protein